MNRRDVAGGPAAERCAAVVLHGVPGSTLRYHEEKGLIASVGRQSLRRTFDPGVLELLSLISLGQAAGFSLDEIEQMFTPDKRSNIKRQMLEDTHAGDMIGEIALAIEMGAVAVDIGKTIHPHPTLGESIGMAAEAAHGSCTDVPSGRKQFKRQLELARPWWGAGLRPLVAIFIYNTGRPWLKINDHVGTGVAGAI